MEDGTGSTRACALPPPSAGAALRETGPPPRAVLCLVLNVADIMLNQDFLIGGIGPFVASLVFLIAGPLVRRVWPGKGRAVILVGIIGFVASAAWLGFGLYVDAVLGDT
jgi:hypothetical protein